LFVSRITQTLLIFGRKKIGGKVAHGPWNNTLDFGGNPNHVKLGSGLG